MNWYECFFTKRNNPKGINTLWIEITMNNSNKKITTVSLLSLESDGSNFKSKVFFKCNMIAVITYFIVFNRFSIKIKRLSANLILH